VVPLVAKPTKAIEKKVRGRITKLTVANAEALSCLAAVTYTEKLAAVSGYSQD